MYVRFAAFLLPLLLGLHSQGQNTTAKESNTNQSVNPPNTKTINWMVHDVPPFLIVKSNNAVVSMADVEGPLAGFYKIIMASMPEYEHRMVRLPIARAMKLVTEQKQICSLIFIESKERHSILHFGEEVTVGLPVGIVTLKDISNSKYILARPEEMDMKRTLEKGNFRLGFVSGRYYTPDLTPLLAKNKASYGMRSDGSITKLFSMLEAGRIEGVLAVYLEMTEYERSNPNGPKMQYMRLKEAPDFTALRVSCEKTPWGEKTVKAISKVVREKNFKGLSNDYLLSQLPADRRKEYLKIYESRSVIMPAAPTTN